MEFNNSTFSVATAGDDRFQTLDHFEHVVVLMQGPHIVVNFDNRTIDKYITGGDFDINTDPNQADYTDTLTAETYIEGVVGSRGDDIMYGMSDGMQSVVIDGQRQWTYGWLQGYYGDYTIVMTGSGDDHARGGYGDDLLISTGTGLNKLDGQGQRHNDYPNYGIITDFATLKSDF